MGNERSTHVYFNCDKNSTKSRSSDFVSDFATSSGMADLPVLKQEAKDPICGMMVEVKTAKHRSEFQGDSFYFCCAGCKQKFDRQPEKYAHVAAP